MKIGKHTPDYIGALVPGPIGKVAKMLAEKRKHEETIDAFRSHTSHNGNVNDND